METQEAYGREVRKAIGALTASNVAVVAGSMTHAYAQWKSADKSVKAMHKLLAVRQEELREASD